MRILVDIGHPAHVHFFKNFIWEMEARGHEVFVITSDKDVTLDLLDKYNFTYELYGKSSNNFIGYLNQLIRGEFKTYKTQQKHDIDIIVGIPNEFGAHVSKITKAKSISFTDSEPATLSNFVTFPFIDVICTPSCFNKNIGRKQIRYNGYHELAYLHPNRFEPDPAVLDELGLSKEDNIIIVRFVAWAASHDIGQHGIQNKIEFVKELEKYGHVLITAESKLDPELEKYRIKISPEKMHDVLFYAKMLIGDSQTMTTEAAMLGTPAIRCNSFVGENDMGNFIELEQKYNLIFNYSDPDKALKKAVELIQKPNLKEDWEIKRDQLLKDKIDVTAFMVNFIENYPNSL